MSGTQRGQNQSIGPPMRRPTGICLYSPPNWFLLSHMKAYASLTVIWIKYNLLISKILDLKKLEPVFSSAVGVLNSSWHSYLSVNDTLTNMHILKLTVITELCQSALSHCIGIMLKTNAVNSILFWFPGFHYNGGIMPWVSLLQCPTWLKTHTLTHTGLILFLVHNTTVVWQLLKLMASLTMEQIPWCYSFVVVCDALQCMRTACL